MYKIFSEKKLNIIGGIGSFIIIIAYFFLMNKSISGNSFEYIIANIVGCIFLSIELFYKKAYGALILEIILIGISFYGLYTEFCNIS